MKNEIYFKRKSCLDTCRRPQPLFVRCICLKKIIYTCAEKVSYHKWDIQKHIYVRVVFVLVVGEGKKTVYDNRSDAAYTLGATKHFGKPDIVGRASCFSRWLECVAACSVRIKLYGAYGTFRVWKQRDLRWRGRNFYSPRRDRSPGVMAWREGTAPFASFIITSAVCTPVLPTAGRESSFRPFLARFHYVNKPQTTRIYRTLSRGCGNFFHGFRTGKKKIKRVTDIYLLPYRRAVKTIWREDGGRAINTWNVSSQSVYFIREGAYENRPCVCMCDTTCE